MAHGCTLASCFIIKSAKQNINADKSEFIGLFLFVFRFESSPSFPPRINFRRAIFVIYHDGVSPIGID